MSARVFALFLILLTVGGAELAQAAPDPADKLPDQDSAQALLKHFKHPAEPLIPWEEPPPAEAPAPIWPNDPNQIADGSSGWGWCSYIDPGAKKAFYSDVFFANGNEGQRPIGVDYGVYMDRFYADYIKLNFGNTGGWANCIWAPYATEYLQRDSLQSDQFSQQLKNYKIVPTSWKP
jgi:hypothetical protein